jgi:hypothetical protein
MICDRRADHPVLVEAWWIQTRTGRGAHLDVVVEVVDDDQRRDGVHQPAVRQEPAESPCVHMPRRNISLHRGDVNLPR